MYALYVSRNGGYGKFQRAFSLATLEKTETRWLEASEDVRHPGSELSCTVTIPR